MEYVCRYCGSRFEGQAPSKRVLPRVYCSRRCKGFSTRAKTSLGEYKGKNTYVGKDGYVRIVLGWGKERLFHVFLMEEHLGVSLRGKYVHHRNGNKLDNRVANLEVMASIGVHLREHAAQRVRNMGLDPKYYKICGRCKKGLLRSKFRPMPSTHDGLYGYCRECAREKARVDYWKNKRGRK